MLFLHWQVRGTVKGHIGGFPHAYGYGGTMSTTSCKTAQVMDIPGITFLWFEYPWYISETNFGFVPESSCCESDALACWRDSIWRALCPCTTRTPIQGIWMFVTSSRACRTPCAICHMSWICQGYINLLQSTKFYKQHTTEAVHPLDKILRVQNTSFICGIRTVYRVYITCPSAQSTWVSSELHLLTESTTCFMHARLVSNLSSSGLVSNLLSALNGTQHRCLVEEAGQRCCTRFSGSLPRYPQVMLSIWQTRKEILQLWQGYTINQYVMSRLYLVYTIPI